MAYNFTKLSETPLVEGTESTPKILIEDNGDIKRISAENIGAGGNASVITYGLSYTWDSGTDYFDNPGLWDGDKFVSAQTFAEQWDSGAIIRIKPEEHLSLPILGVSYDLSSGAINGAQIFYCADSSSFGTLFIY